MHSGAFVASSASGLADVWAKPVQVGSARESCRNMQAGTNWIPFAKHTARQSDSTEWRQLQPTGAQPGGGLYLVGRQQGLAMAAGTTYRGPRRTEPARLPDGASDQSARQHSFYVSDDGDLTALRYDNWKVVFLEQRATGTLNVWAEPFTELRVPKIFNLRTDPFERADITSNTYYDWLLDHAWVLVPAQAYVARMLQTLVDFPPRQEPASFSLDKVLEKLRGGVASA